MNTSISKDQITFSFGEAMIAREDSYTGHKDGVRVQFYWPRVTFKFNKPDIYWPAGNKEFAFHFHNTFRTNYQKGYFGIGFRLLGFGAGFDWQKQKGIIKFS